MFPLRASYPNWHQDLKSDEDLIREEDIQIIQKWRSLDNSGPSEVLCTNYSFGLEYLEGWNSPRGLSWWKFKSSSKEGRGIQFKECKVLPHHTPNQAASLQWIWMQNQDKAEDTGLVQLLQEEIEALKEHKRHIKVQMPKSRKKPK